MLHSRHDFKWARAGRVILWLAALVALGAGLAWRARAQSSPSSWTEPVNVSRSGAASQPVIAVAPDGTLHALWWDSVEGEKYAWTTSVTGTLWTGPASVESIVGERVVDDVTGLIRKLTAPRDLRLVSDRLGNLYALWFDAYDQLMASQTRGGWWSGATVLDDWASGMDIVIDEKGALHLAYLRTRNSPGNPSGVYYRTFGGYGWSTPVLVYASSYFRTLAPEQIYLSIAGDGQGQVLVAWDDPAAGKSFYARSANGGQTWSAPQAVDESPTAPATQARVACAPGGDFFFLWHDAAAGGCGLSQRRSTDGGQTWSAPERVLSSLSRCPGRWQFVLAGAPSGEQAPAGKLWLVGTPRSGESAAGGAGVLAAWDGKTWSEPTNVSLGFRDPGTGAAVSLGCLGVSLAGQSVGLIGCDAKNDVWAARNAVTLDSLAMALKPIWNAPQVLSDQSGQEAGLPALVADGKGKLYALWGQSPAETQPGQALYAAVWDGSRWSRSAQVLRSPAMAEGLLPGSSAVSKAEQPALAADNYDRLHAVWSGGTGGEIFYSWTFARDATSAQAWSQPVALPAPSMVGSWPDILADPRGEALYVIYAVPYNEGRGIYAVRSDTGGAAWLTPTVVFDAVAAGWDSADKPRLALDAHAGLLHAVWLRATLPGSTGAQAVFYARSADGGLTWSAPLKIAEGAVDWPRVAVAGANQVHVIWNQARAKSSSFEVWHQYALGERWSEPARVRGFEAMSGPASLAPDGAGGLYLVGAGQGSGGESALLYARWRGAAWDARETFGLGQVAAQGNAAAAAVLPGAGRLSAVLRERVWRANGTRGFEVVATGRDVAAVVVTPAPTFTPLPTHTPLPTATPPATPTARPLLRATGTPQPIETGPLRSMGPLIASGALAMAVVLVVAIWQVAWMRRR